MKDISKLKNEQATIKSKLVKLIEFTCTEEFYNASEEEKGLILIQKTGMEMYLTALSKRIYLPEKEEEQ